VPVPHVLVSKPFRARPSTDELTETETPRLSHCSNSRAEWITGLGAYPEVLTKRPFRTKKSDKRPTRTIPFPMESAYGPPPIAMPAMAEAEDAAPTAATQGMVVREQDEIKVPFSCFNSPPTNSTKHHQKHSGLNP